MREPRPSASDARRARAPRTCTWPRFAHEQYARVLLEREDVLASTTKLCARRCVFAAWSLHARPATARRVRSRRCSHVVRRKAVRLLIMPDGFRFTMRRRHAQAARARSRAVRRHLRSARAARRRRAMLLLVVTVTEELPLSARPTGCFRTPPTQENSRQRRRPRRLVARAVRLVLANPRGAPAPGGHAVFILHT